MSSGLNFNTFWEFFWRCSFAVQLALVSMITITVISSLSFFSLQRTKIFRTRGEQGYTLRCCGKLSTVIFVAVAPKQRSPKLSGSWLTLYTLADGLPVSAGKFGRALQRHVLVDFQTKDIVGKLFSCSKRGSFAFVNRTRNGRAAAARSLPMHRLRD